MIKSFKLFSSVCVYRNAGRHLCRTLHYSPQRPPPLWQQLQLSTVMIDNLCLQCLKRGQISKHHFPEHINNRDLNWPLIRSKALYACPENVRQSNNNNSFHLQHEIMSIWNPQSYILSWQLSADCSKCRRKYSTLYSHLEDGGDY